MQDNYNLLKTLNNLTSSNISIFPELIEYQSFWENWIDKYFYSYPYPKVNEVFPLIHNFNGISETIYINVEAFKNIYIKQPDAFMPISSLNESLYYYSNSKSIGHSTKETPIFAINLPCNLPSGESVPFAIIDGNHRLSYAKRIKKEVQIYCLDICHPSPVFFISTRDWLLYHLLISYYFFIFKKQDITDDYFKELALLLSQFWCS